jgi:hypothetical protein
MVIEVFEEVLGDSGFCERYVRPIHTYMSHVFKNVIRFAGVNWKPSIELASSFGLGGCPVGEGASG